MTTEQYEEILEEVPQYLTEEPVNGGLISRYYNGVWEPCNWQVGCLQDADTLCKAVTGFNGNSVLRYECSFGTTWYIAGQSAVLI